MSQCSSSLALKASFEYELTNNDPPPVVREYMEKRVAEIHLAIAEDYLDVRTY